MSFAEQRQHPLLSSHLSSQSFCHRRLPDWLSMISPWLNHVDCPDQLTVLHMLRNGLWDELFHHLSWVGGEADSSTVSWVLLFALFEDWSDTGLLSVLRHRSCPSWPLKDDASNIHQFPQYSRVHPIRARGPMGVKSAQMIPNPSLFHQRKVFLFWDVLGSRVCSSSELVSEVKAAVKTALSDSAFSPGLLPCSLSG